MWSCRRWLWMLAKNGQNVTSSSTAVAALEAARDKKAPIILQMSQGGAAYFAGKVGTRPVMQCSLAHLVPSFTRPAYWEGYILTSPGCRQRQPRSLNRRSHCRSPLYPLGRSSVWNPSRLTHGSLREEAAAVAGWHDGCR